jgi:hypothetical protein
VGACCAFAAGANEARRNSAATRAACLLDFVVAMMAPPDRPGSDASIRYLREESRCLLSLMRKQDATDDAITAGIRLLGCSGAAWLPTSGGLP